MLFLFTFKLQRLTIVVSINFIFFIYHHNKQIKFSSDKWKKWSKFEDSYIRLRMTNDIYYSVLKDQISLQNSYELFGKPEDERVEKSMIELRYKLDPIHYLPVTTYRD